MVHGDTAQPRSCRGLCENTAERSHSTDGGPIQQSEPIMYEDQSFRIKSCAELFTGGCGDKKQNHSCQLSLRKSSLPLTDSFDAQPDTGLSGEETAHSHDIGKSEVQDSISVESGYDTTHRHLLCKAPANTDLPHGSTCKSSSLPSTPGQCRSGLQFLPKHVPPESTNQHQSPLHRASVADTVRGSDTCAHTAISAVNSTGVSRSPKTLKVREDTGESSSQRGEVSPFRHQFSQQRLDTPKKKSVPPPHPILVYFKEGNKTMTQFGCSTLTRGDQGNFSRKFPLRWLTPDSLFRSELIGQPPSHAGSCWRPRTCPATFGVHNSSIHGNSFHRQSMAHSGLPSVNTMGGSVQRRISINAQGYSPQPSSFNRHWPLYSGSSSICLSKSIQDKVNQKVKGLQLDKGLKTEHTRSRSLVAMKFGLEHSNCNLSTIMVDGTSCGSRDTEDVGV